MQFSVEDLLTPDQILADVARTLGDEEYLEFTKGRLKSLMQQALSELSFDTMLLKLHKDYDMPTKTLRISLPPGSFNIREVYIYDGDFGQVNSPKNVHYKRRYKTTGYDKNYTAKNIPDAGDPFVRGQWGNQTNMYWCNEDEVGYLTLSPACASYSKVRVVYNGTLTKIGNTPFVPEILRQAVKGWIIEQCMEQRAIRDPRMYRGMWQDIYTKLYKPYSGTWDVAKDRVKSLDTKFTDDMYEYLSKGNW